MAEPCEELKVKTVGLVPAGVKTAAKKKAPVKEKRPTMYERMKAEAPVHVVEGAKGHPLDEFGPAYWTKGTPRLLRGGDEHETPEDPFIYSQGPKRRLKIQGGMMIGPTVNASPEATMAHEVGHVTDSREGGLAGKILQTGWARGGGQMLGTGLGAVGGVMAGHALWKKPHLAIPASMAIGAAGAGLGSVPTLLSESRATKRGVGRLREAGATEKQMERYNAQLAGAYGTYKRQALINAVGGGLLAPAVLLRTKLGAAEAGASSLGDTAGLVGATLAGSAAGGAAFGIPAHRREKEFIRQATQGYGPVYDDIVRRSGALRSIGADVGGFARSLAADPKWAKPAAMSKALGAAKKGIYPGGLLAGGGMMVYQATRDRNKTAEAKPTGAYKGQPMSPHTVKFKTEFQGIPINVDRPKGFIMKGTDAKGNDWARRYKLDYGFIPKTLGGDGDGLDVFIGPDKKADYAFWAMQRDDAGNFDEYKVFLGFPDRDAAVAAYRQHIPKKYFKGIVTMKVEMMKAMLGKVNPDEKMKRASAASMLDELGWLMSTMEKEAASALRARTYLTEVMPGKFVLKLKGGGKGGKDIAIGHAGTFKGQIGETSIAPKYRGMGLGKKMYGDIMRRMPEQTLKSDNRMVSREAARIWEGMGKRKGYKLRKGPQKPSEIPGLHGPGVAPATVGQKEPMFSASLPPEAAL